MKTDRKLFHWNNFKTKKIAARAPRVLKIREVTDKNPAPQSVGIKPPTIEPIMAAR